MPIQQPSWDPSKNTASQNWDLEVTNRLNQLEYDLNNELTVQNVVSQNYDGRTQGEVFSDFSDNPGTQGYYLDSNTGSIIMNNALIRGKSIINAANIGTDAYNAAASSSIDEELNSQVGGDSGAYPDSVSGNTLNFTVDKSVAESTFVTYTLPVGSNGQSFDWQEGGLRLWSRATTNQTGSATTPVLNESQYSDVNMSVTISLKYYNSSSTQVGSTISETYSGSNSFWNWVYQALYASGVTPATVISRRYADIPYSNFPDPGTVPSGAVTLKFNVAITVNSSANWGIVAASTTASTLSTLSSANNIILAGNVTKPTNTTAFIGSNDPDKYGLTVNGGLVTGARVILDGGTSLSHASSEYLLTDKARLFAALLEWDDTGTGGWNKVETGIVTFVLPASGDQSLYGNESGHSYSLHLAHLTNAYYRIGELFISADDNTGTSSLVFTTFNSNAAISGPEIKKVWEILTL
jgi:hypothetical protein